MLTVVEDAHWADPTTRELLDLLVAQAPEMALLLVVTHRPEFDAGAWLGEPHVTPLQLNRLAPAEHAALLPTLTSADLREIGVASLGHRRRLLAGIAALAERSEAPPETRAAAPEAGSPAVGPRLRRRRGAAS